MRSRTPGVCTLKNLVRTRRSLGAAVLGSALVLPCAGASARIADAAELQGSLARKEQRVVGGEESSRSAVVHVTSVGADGEGSSCSGTMVAPNLLLTGLHCISALQDGRYSCGSDGSVDENFPRIPAQAGSMGRPFPPDRIGVSVGEHYRETIDAYGIEVIAPQSDTICSNDVAFVVMERDLDTKFLSVRLGRGMVPGETIAVVGYGLSEYSSEGISRRERSGLELLGVGPSEFYDQEGQSPPRTFIVGPGPCKGDSGGPAISELTSEVVGTFSFLRPVDCESSLVRAYYTQVAAFEPYVRQAFEAAGHPELLDRSTEEPGGGGMAGSPSTSSSGDGEGGCQLSFGSGPGAAWALSLFALGLAQVMRRRSSARLPTVD